MAPPITVNFGFSGLRTGKKPIPSITGSSQAERVLAKDLSLDDKIIRILSHQNHPMSVSQLARQVGLSREDVTTPGNDFENGLNALVREGLLTRVRSRVYAITNKGREHAATLPPVVRRGKPKAAAIEPVQPVRDLSPEELESHILAALSKANGAKKPWEIDDAIKINVRNLSPGVQNTADFIATKQALSRLVDRKEILLLPNFSYKITETDRQRAVAWLASEGKEFENLNYWTT